MILIILFVTTAFMSAFSLSGTGDSFGRWALDNEKTYSVPKVDKNKEPSLVMNIGNSIISFTNSDGRTEAHYYSLINDGTEIFLIEESCSGRSFTLLARDGPWLVMYQRSCADYPTYCEVLTQSGISDIKSEQFDEKNPPLYFRVLPD